jgi:hypothetical protein
METKQQQQKMPATKNSNLDLDAFLHSVTCLPIKDINKYFIFNLSDTNDIMFSLTDFLEFDPIKNYYHKSCVLSCTNGTILDITFRFTVGHNMRLIFDYFYAPRKKRRLLKHLDLMCGQDSTVPINIEFRYIDFLFSFIFSFSFKILVFLFFYFFSYFYNFVIVSWNLVIFFRYVSNLWKVWGSFFYVT